MSKKTTTKSSSAKSDSGAFVVINLPADGCAIPRSSSPTVIHKSRLFAQNEANRLAKTAIGSRFGVFECLGFACAQVPVPAWSTAVEEVKPTNVIEGNLRFKPITNPNPK